MTKRKRDIFTIIESINNWLEASEPTTNTIEGSEGDTGNLGTIHTSSDSITTNGWVVEGVGPDNNAKPWTEAVQLASNRNHGGTDLGLKVEVAANSIPEPKVSTQWAAVSGSVPGPEVSQGNGDREGGQATEYPQGTVDNGTNNITRPGTEPEVERELAIKAFWRVLADAKYTSGSYTRMVGSSSY